MLIEIEENTYLNTDMIVAVELITISSEPYGETYQWLFFTTSTGEKKVFHSRIFDDKEEAIRWFDELKYYIDRKGA
ncbi:MAG: hypothetical protein GXN94_00490 [Aquificae bacterium]|nr:hypothetical protein [Aquificota bacterium]